MSRLRRSLLWPAAFLGLLFLCLYLLTGSSDLVHNGDTQLRYQTTQAIVEHHRLWLDAPAYRDTRVAVGRGNHLYAFYGPGQTLLMVPFYVAGKVAAHHLHLPYELSTSYATRSLDLVLGACLAMLFFFFAMVTGYSRRASVLLSLLFGIATAAWPDAQSALEQTQVDVFLLLGVLAVVHFMCSGRRSRWWLVLAATGVGGALVTRYDALLYLPFIPAYLAIVRWRYGEQSSILGDWMVYGLAVIPWLILLAVWDLVRFGSPFITGLHEQTFGEPFLQGLANLLVSPGKGLVWYIPILFLLAATVRNFSRRAPLVAGLCGLLVALPLIFYANVLYWHGDPAWGPRYLYVALPYLVIPLGELFERWQRTSRILQLGAVLLILLSIGIQICAVSVTQWRFWYRLQALQEQSVHADQWVGQPFRWGADHYHYYWNVRQSPLLIQIDDVYQVSRLVFTRAERYRLVSQPDPYVHSNPALIYPVNNFVFWWADERHPLFGRHVTAVLALGLVLGILLALAGLAASLRGPPGKSSNEIASAPRLANVTAAN